MKKALTIAGSDSCGGAGIQADLKTFAAFGIYGMSAVTALTAQNTVGVQSVMEVPPEFVGAQIDSVASDTGADAVKTGMLASPAIVETVAEAMARHGLRRLVVDPVMVAKSGEPRLPEAARQVLKERLIPLAEVITPNGPEAEVLAGGAVKTLDDMREAAARLRDLGCAWVVVKGGHLVDEPEAVDVVFDGRDFTILSAPYLEGTMVHGTGCTFSAAVAAGLAAGSPALDAIRAAKDYVTRAIAGSLRVGRGHPAPDHLAGTRSEWTRDR